MTAFSNPRFRNATGTIVLVGLAAIAAASGAQAQIVPYVGLGLERVPLEGPPVPGLASTSGLRRLILLGFSHRAPGVAHAFEIELGWLSRRGPVAAGAGRLDPHGIL